MFLFIFFFGGVFALHVPQNLVVLSDTILTDVDFYEKISKDDWDVFDVDKKRRVFDDFLKNELAYYDAIKKGLDLNPKTFLSLKTRKKQVLLNNIYEHIIARPLVDPLVVEKNIKNLQKKTEAYHLLVGYKGSSQNTESTISKQAAKTLVDSLYLAIKKESVDKNLEDVFMDFAFDYSIDPSVKQNRGFLGWVPWGRTTMSFQEALFDLPKGVLSSPVHTEYGYHLILKKTIGLSSHYYYSQENYLDLSFKIAESSLSFDSLRVLSSSFDSLTIKKTGLSFNSSAIDSLVGFVLKKQKQERLAGNKNQIIDWLLSLKNKVVLFSKNDRVFGVGWLINQLKETPSSRVPPLKTKKDLKDLLVFFVLQEEVLKLDLEKNILKTTSFKRDWLNNKKNIIYNDYISFLLNSLAPIDSALVIKEYKEQTLEERLLKPKRVAFSEIRVFDFLVAKEIVEQLALGASFDSLLVLFGGSIKEPVSITKKSPLAVSLFKKKTNDISEIIKNNDGSFSIARVERFLEKEFFSLDLVYQKLEREILTSMQDVIKGSLLETLINDLKPTINPSVLGL